MGVCLLGCATWTAVVVHFVGLLAAAGIVATVALLGMADGALDRAGVRSPSDYR